MFSPVVASQTRAFPSSEPVRMYSPSGDQTTALTAFVWVRTRIFSPEVASQTYAVESFEPVRIRLPSGDQATALTALSWWSARMFSPVVASQMHAFPSSEPVRIKSASGAHSIAVMVSECPPKTCISECSSDSPCCDAGAVRTSVSRRSAGNVCSS